MTDTDSDTEENTHSQSPPTYGWYYKGWGSPLYPFPTY